MATKTKKRASTSPALPTTAVSLTQSEIFWALSRLEKLGGARNKGESDLMSKLRGVYQGAPIPLS